MMPFVLYNSDSSRYEMWFTASTDGDRPFRIGYAVSPDGISWTEHPSPVLEPDAGTWDELTVEGPMVLRENQTYTMWYTGWGPSHYWGNIGIATSSDGINWTKDSSNPIMIPDTSAWEAGGPHYPSILPVQGGYKMWYAGYNAEFSLAMIGYATSSDGISWQRDVDNNPVLTIGAPGEWDYNGVTPQVILIDPTYHLWYNARPYNGNPSQVGYAASTDGITWTKYDDSTTTNPPYSDSDPVLKPSPGQWDGEEVSAGNVIILGDTLHMWYDGYKSPFSSNPLKIGHATLPRDSLFKYWTILNIDKGSNERIAVGYVLDQNYPNPFNPVTMINYRLPISSDVKIYIYNVIGQKLVTLVNKRQKPGYHQVEWNASGFASGVYYYRIEAGYFEQTRKMIYLK
jgi:predicted GH43/DUF377 family glycosyl hydrolase